MYHRMQVRQRGIRFRLYPTHVQEHALLGQGHGVRALWNLLHEWQRMAFENRPFDLKAADAAVKQARKDTEWLGLIPAQAAQQVLKTYFRAWQSCWAGTHEAPKYKPRTGWHGVDVPQARDIKLVKESKKWSSVQLPLVGRVRFRQHRALSGKISGARIIREPDGKWFLIFRTEQTVRAANPQKTAVKPTVGIDRGVAIPLALSSGTDYTHQQWLTQGEAQRLLRLERQSAHQRTARKRDKRGWIGSNERKTYTKIAALHARARRRRTDFLHYTTRRIADTYSVVGVEALNITGMTKAPVPRPDPQLPGNYLPNGGTAKAGLARVVLGEAWATFHTLLTYKMLDRAGTVVPVPAPYTSLRCHQCRIITPDSRENQSHFACKNPACGWLGNADYNASCNIELDALEKLVGHIKKPMRVHSSALKESVVLFPTGGTSVAARPVGNDAGTLFGAEPAYAGVEAGTKHGEPVQTVCSV